MGEGVTGSVVQSGKSLILPAIDPEEMMARAAPAYREFLERFPTLRDALRSPARRRSDHRRGDRDAREQGRDAIPTEDLRLFEELVDARGSGDREQSSLRRDAECPVPG